VASIRLLSCNDSYQLCNTARFLQTSHHYNLFQRTFFRTILYMPEFCVEKLSADLSFPFKCHVSLIPSRCSVLNNMEITCIASNKTTNRYREECCTPAEKYSHHHGGGVGAPCPQLWCSPRLSLLHVVSPDHTTRRIPLGYISMKSCECLGL
jgi:hypothetical protein